MSSHEGIARISIEGPGRNLLNPDTMARLADELRAADGDATTTGIVVSGAGDVFCGGLDIDALRGGGDPIAFASALVDLLKLFPLLGTPIVARVNGDAIASGSSIVSACDYAVAVPSARIGTYEVSIGIWPMVAQVPLIKRLGARAAMENIGSGEPFTADRARELGLINLVASPEQLDDAIVAWLQAAARGGEAVPAGRRSVYELAELPYSDALDRALEKFSGMFPER